MDSVYFSNDSSTSLNTRNMINNSSLFQAHLDLISFEIVNNRIQRQISFKKIKSYLYSECIRKVDEIIQSHEEEMNNFKTFILKIRQDIDKLILDVRKVFKLFISSSWLWMISSTFLMHSEYK